MPAASTKPETKSSSEAMDPMKQAINLLDKKVRNLEKRKSKLDSYKEKAEKGNVLEKDQEEAISHYSEVHQILEFAKDLQKQYSLITQECEKLMKKQAKREKLEKQVLEQKRFREILQLQGMLDSLGSENIRNDFKTGKQGAVVLTEENLNQMDELFKLISPSRDGETDYEEQLTNAAEHISSLLDAKDKEVVGTTYKELRELMDLINGCGYFENMPSQEEEEVEEGQADQPVIEAQEQPDDLEQPVLEDPQPVMSAVTASEPLPIQFSQPMENEVAEAESAQQEAPLDNDYQNYSESAAAYQRQRPFQEIVSSVQGSFNFLQESTIDIESPHMDPAVVAMGPAPIPHPTPSEAGPGYGSQSLLADHHHATQSPAQSSHLDDTDPQQSMADYSTAGYNVNHSAAGFPLDDTSTNHTSQNILNQAASAASLNDPAVAGMMAAHIPIPNQSNTLSQDDLSDSNQPEKKPFTMNANAAVFQSMYTQGSGGQGQAGMDKSQGSSSQGGDYQNNYQGNNFRGNRGYRGGRGNQRGGAGMSNGYSRGGSRGGSVNGRGGFGRDNRDTERAPYQGYPPRNDYRPEGYQGYNNNNSGYNNNAGYYNKRGGPNRGSSRGGPRGSSSGGGRGGSGPRSGGFGRPMNAQATMGQ